MMILSVEEILDLHERMIRATGGSHGLRDRGLLESAVYSAETVFCDQECYPTVEEKAARLMYALTNDHAFIDGNKRIGVFVMLMTLSLNGAAIHPSQSDLIHLGLAVADGSMDYDDILKWIKKQQS